MNFVANEAGGSVHEVHSLAKSVFEVDLMALGDGDAVGDNDHAAIYPRRASNTSGHPPQNCYARRRMTVLWSRLLLASCFFTAACSGGGTYVQGEYANGETRYALRAPGEGWQSIDVDRQNDLAWRSASIGAVVQANSTCSVEYDVPLTALTNHLFVGFTEREIESQELQPMDGREALHTHARAKLDGVVRELYFVVLKKDNCTYDFALVAPPGAPFERARPVFTTMLESFSTR